MLRCYEETGEVQSATIRAASNLPITADLEQMLENVHYDV